MTSFILALLLFQMIPRCDTGGAVVLVQGVDLTETFETDPYDNTWTETLATHGTFTEQYSADAISGTYSLYAENSGGDEPGSESQLVNVFKSSTDSITVFWKMKLVEPPSDWTYVMRYMHEGGGSSISRLRMNSSRQIDLSTGSYTVEAMATNTVYNCWYVYTKSTDTDAVSFSTGTSRPTSGDFYSAGAPVNTGHLRQLWLLAPGRNGASWIFDDVKIREGIVNDVP